jgi:putative ABC transport system substrate-binding protein
VPRLLSIIRDGLRELGWIEGENVRVEIRYAENNLDRLPGLAADLVSLKADVIVAGGTLAPLAAKRITSTIPIVMTSAGDPLGSGLVASLARPGGNVTGLSVMSPALGAKRLELLKEVAPNLSRTAVLWNAANPYSELVFNETAGAAQTLGIKLQSLEVRGPADFDTVLVAATGQHIDGLITVDDPLTLGHREKITQFAARNRLPAIYGLREFVEAGGLMSYGADLGDLARRTVVYIDKILKGARPSDLPVELPTKFELVIDLRVGRALGLTVPQLLLAKADQVIE